MGNDDCLAEDHDSEGAPAILKAHPQTGAAINNDKDFTSGQTTRRVIRMGSF